MYWSISGTSDTVKVEIWDTVDKGNVIELAIPLLIIVLSKMMNLFLLATCQYIMYMFLYIYQ